MTGGGSRTKSLDRALLQSLRNQVFVAVQQAGLEPSAFEWRVGASKFSKEARISVLWHTPSSYYFRFDLQNDSHACRYAPGSTTPNIEAVPGSWRAQMAHVGQWLNYLKREIDAPDLWATLSGGSTLIAAAAAAQPSENTPFSSADKRRIETSLAEIRALLTASHEISTDSLGRIDAQLTYLTGAADRLGRKDWLNVAIAVVVNIIMTAAVPPETATSILNLTGTVLAWVLGGSPLLPKPLP